MKFIFGLLAVFIISSVSFAQSVSLRGQVTDQNGAVIPKAKVRLDGPSGLVKTAATDDRGGYSFTELPPGDYSVTASAPNLALMEPAKITLKSGVHALDTNMGYVSG
jgi:protocatechuate 3,4-dioxygenase beta subunit